jgi:peptidase E
MPKIGASTAANTTPAASGSSLCKTIGTNASMFRVIRSGMVIAGMGAGRMIMGRTRKTAKITVVIVIAKAAAKH